MTICLISFHLFFIPVKYCIVKFPATTRDGNVPLYILHRSHCWKNENVMFIKGLFCVQFLVKKYKWTLNYVIRGTTFYKGWISFCTHIFNKSQLTVLFHLLLSSRLSRGSSKRALWREKFLGRVRKCSVELVGSFISHFSFLISSLTGGFFAGRDFRASVSALCL